MYYRAIIKGSNQRFLRRTEQHRSVRKICLFKGKVTQRSHPIYRSPNLLVVPSIKAVSAKHPLTLKDPAAKKPHLLSFRRSLICRHQQSQGASNVF